jgi:glycosyltransferase involved in cell wall biosynthesis
MKPLHVLHVLGAMNRGGVEAWLMHVLRHLDRESFQTDLLVHTEQPAAYDSEVRALGSRILPCPYAGNPALYARHFLQIVKRHGPFDVLHSHVHQFSGFVLALGRIAGIPVRIAHSHSDTAMIDSGANLARTAYLKFASRLIAANCTHGLAVSKAAATALFGPNWLHDPRFRVLYCGIDPTPFDEPFSPAQVRTEFGFSGGDIVFGHVGSFSLPKNHAFVLETAAEIRRIEPRAKFLLVGDGPLRAEMEGKAHALGLDAHIVFAGIRSDIPRLMTSALDLLLFPSLHEGLPLALLEAQAAGLTCIVSENITQEAVISPALIRYLPLSAGAGQWAHVALETATEPRFDRGLALEILRASPFEINRSLRHLCAVYLERAEIRPRSTGLARPVGTGL